MVFIKITFNFHLYGYILLNRLDFDSLLLDSLLYKARNNKNRDTAWGINMLQWQWFGRACWQADGLWSKRFLKWRQLFWKRNLGRPQPTGLTTWRRYLGRTGCRLGETYVEFIEVLYLNVLNILCPRCLIKFTKQLYDKCYGNFLEHS